MPLHPIVRATLVAAAFVLSGACATPANAQQAQAEMTRQLYLFQYAPGPAWRAGVPMREQGLGPHGAYMQRLMQEGRLYAGGGYVDADGGMAIVIASSMDEARVMLDADPAITSGIFVAELRHWRPRFRSDGPLPASN